MVRTVCSVRVFALASILLGCAQPLLGQPCAGDCNGDGEVTLHEVMLGVRISMDLGGASVSHCPSADVDGDGFIGVSDAVAASQALRHGCGGAPGASLQRRFAVVSGPAAPVIELTDETGSPGSQVTFSSILHTGGVAIAGIEQEIHVDPLTPLVSCATHPSASKTLSAVLRPNGCTAGVDCTSMKALYLSFFDLDPIPDGETMFTCTVEILASAPDAVYTLDSRAEDGASPSGASVSVAGIDGSITVLTPPTLTPTPTATPTPRNVAASLILQSLRFKADTATRPGRSNGSLRARGVVNANDPFAFFVEDIDASGLNIRVEGVGGVDELLHWGESDCEVRASARSTRIRCRAEDAAGKRRADFRTTSVPNLFRARVFASRLGFAPPLVAGTAQVTIATTTFQRADTIGDCRVRRRQRRARCRESGFVPTPTQPPTPTPTFTATVTAPPTDTPFVPNGTFIVVGDATGMAGGTAVFTVGLETNAMVAGTENELHLSATEPITFINCVVDPGINKSLISSFPSPQDFRGIVISFSNLDPIPNASTMYSCEVAIGAGASLSDHLINCSAPGSSDPVGNAIATQCVDGTLTVVP